MERLTKRGTRTKSYVSAIMYPGCTENSWVWVIGFERISREEAMP